MATETRGGAGIKNRNIAKTAGIRPFKMDINYATEAAFLAAKGSAVAEGDWFYDTTDNVLKVYDGSSWVSSTLGAGSVNGANAATVASANAVGGIPVLHMKTLTAGANATTAVATLTYKTRIIDAWVVLQEAAIASSTIQLKNASTAITEALALNGKADKDIVRFASIDDAQWEVAAGAALNVTTAAGATQGACTVFVLGVKVA
jgi:hypothetical protein